MLPASFVVTKAPAGTASVPNLRNTFLDKAEVTNSAWREYVLYQKDAFGAESPEYHNAIPDTATWKLSYNVSFFTSDRYNDWPVVGISYEQAKAFCKWRSEIISAKEKREITYSLPSMKVFKLSSRDASPNKIAEGLYSTTIGFRTFLGICENADEMTNVEGLAIMGSKRTECLDTLNYVVPTHHLSFRCMAVVR